MADTALDSTEAHDEATGHQSTQTGLKSRPKIARYDMFFNQRMMRYELRKTHKPVIEEKLKRKKAILIVKRLIDSRGQYTGTEISIHHEALRKFMLEINKDVEGLELTARNPSVQSDVFYHSYQQLQDKQQSLQQAEFPEKQDSELLEGIEAALYYIHADLQRTIDDVNVLSAQGQITYDYLWALFRPNAYVYSHDTDTEQPVIAHARELRYVRTQDEAYAKLICDIIAHDAWKFGLSKIAIKIPLFSGTRSIIELPVYPLDYHPTKDALRRNAISRGKRYAKLRLPIHFCQHHGVATVIINDKPLRLTINERIMFDTESFFEYQSNNEHAQRFTRYVSRPLNPDELLDEEFLICTPVILGFSFTTKAWGAFAIDRMTDVQWTSEPFDSLRIDREQKTLIRSLVMEHTARAADFDDVVAGKGRGLVGLLCGNPGCGKTLTAEAVAEIIHKPLYAVSAGEIGTDPERTDSSLRRILRLGERWNAVMLLDEADVFLQKRDTTDVSRNALVSIFLRQVEYHPGVLIFTTNLIQQIDPAFESRIHFCVKYPDLNFDSRKAIWQTFLSKAGITKDSISERELTCLAERHLNGRQIKNVISIAKSVAWAEHKKNVQDPSRPQSSILSEGPQVAPSHVRLVLDVMQNWRVAQGERTSYTYPITVGAAGIACALVVLIRWRFGSSVASVL